MIGQRSRQRRVRPALRVEPLEARQLLSRNVLVLDFTPDRLPGETPLRGFAREFERFAGENGPRFLDFNGDGVVDTRDARRAAAAIKRRVARYFKGYDIEIVAGDVTANRGLGRRWLARGESQKDLYVMVLYVGGRDRWQPDVWGVAYQAPVGSNNEYYAYAYAGSMVRWFQQFAPSASPTLFRDEAALTIAHEAGHLMGLGHVKDHPPTIPSVMNYSIPPNRARFIDQAYTADLIWRWGQQNPHREIIRSLRGQPATHLLPTYSLREGPAENLVLDRAPQPPTDAARPLGATVRAVVSELTNSHAPRQRRTTVDWLLETSLDELTGTIAA